MTRWSPAILSFLVLSASLAVHVWEPPLLVTLRNDALDFYQRLWPRTYQPAPVRIVAIDPESLETVGQWPWPRTVMAQLVQRLTNAGAAAVVFDIVFPEADRANPKQLFQPWFDRPEIRSLAQSLPDNDDGFAQAIADARVVVGHILVHEETDKAPEVKAGFATAGDDPRLFLHRFVGADTTLPVIEAAAAGNGALNYIPDDDAVVRRVPLLLTMQDEIVPTLPSEALRVATGAPSYLVRSSGATGGTRLDAQSGIKSVVIGGVPVATDRRGEIILHYAHTVAERYVPARKILDASAAPELIAGHIVLIGATAPGLQDIRYSPLNVAIPGIEIHAQTLEQVIQGTYLTRPYWAVAAERVFLVLVAIALILLIPRLGALWSAAVGACVVAIAVSGAAWAFNYERLVFDPFTPSLTALMIYILCSVLRHRQTEYEKRWINEAFSTYVSPNVVQHLIAQPEQLSLGGERRECSFLFTDLAGFTSLVESTEPSQLSGLLNEYLDGMTQIVFAHEGTLDKFVGDALFAMFSAPVAQDDHAARAVACALEIDAFAQAYADRQQAQGVPFGVTRIGVNSGEAIVGNFGSSSVFDYTAFGDAVNVAARLESVNKQLGTRMCIAASTAGKCPGFSGRPVGGLVLKGTTRPIDVLEPLSTSVMSSDRIVRYLRAYELLKADDPAACTLFETLSAEFPDDGLIRFHHRRLHDGETGTTVHLSEK